MFRLKGYTAAVFTPFNSQGALDVDKIAGYADHLQSIGVPNAFVTGTTGEFPSLTVEERKKIAEAWMSSSMSNVVIHVGSCSLPATKALAAHAASISVAGISAVPPWYVPPQTVDALVEYISEVAAEAPNTPFFYYHIPQFTNCKIQVSKFLEAAVDRIPNLCGLKFSYPDLIEMTECTLVANGKFQVLSGCDNLYLAGRTFGITEAIGATFNFIPGCFKRLDAAYDNGDMKTAYKEIIRVKKFCDTMEVYNHFGFVSAFKGIVKVTPGLGDLGLDVPRLPLKSISEVKEDCLKKDLEKSGYFEWRLQQD